jgi:hypothetical protein
MASRAVWERNPSASIDLPSIKLNRVLEKTARSLAGERRISLATALTDCSSCAVEADEIRGLQDLCRFSLKILSGQPSNQVIFVTDFSTKMLEVPYYSSVETDEPDEDIVDWNYWIETAPPRPSGKILVKLQFRGRSKHIPVGPEDE